MMGRPLWWAIGAVVGTGVAVAARGDGLEVLYGTGAPVFGAATSWVAMTRAWAEAPASSLRVMVRMFAVKSLLFVGYVAIMLKGLGVRPVPFVASLTISFLVLHFVEAWCLKRLMAGTN